MTEPASSWSAWRRTSLYLVMVLVLSASTAYAKQKKEKKSIERDLTPEQLAVMVDDYREEVDHGRIGGFRVARIRAVSSLFSVFW